MNKRFDVIVIGGGHAGIEAAYAAARLNCATALVTLTRDTIGKMPCNPALGGIGKGHMVFEIAALGGLMPQLATQTYLQGRMLNTRKGPAVQGLRLQIDKIAYALEAQRRLSVTPNLTIIEGMADEVITHNGRVAGLVLADGTRLEADAVVITTGTFLKGVIHIGEESYPAGRRGEQTVTKLAEWLYSLNLKMGRLKTGTPPRILRKSINFSVLEEQRSDILEQLFEFEPHRLTHKESCYITQTNERTHEIIAANSHRSPMYSGAITGVGPRYCPSIEDKVKRFAGKNSHTVFIEPEYSNSDEMYPNGISTSLPRDVQEAFVRTIKGFEEAIIAQPGYAVEYDFVHPEQLQKTLELQALPGLYLAGQINGTTGYEEAAGQGLIAGINAAARVKGQEPYIMDRTEGYIGIMVDDLVSLGVDEPYRMFTSRAERRLILRQDNVFARLSQKAYSRGLISKEAYEAVDAENELVHEYVKIFTTAKEHRQFTTTISIIDPDEAMTYITQHTPAGCSQRALTQIYAELLYKPYLIRELKEIEKAQVYKDVAIPEGFSFSQLPGLSRELQEKLQRHRPKTIGQASLVQGMTPAAISLLIFRVKRDIAYTG